MCLSQNIPKSDNPFPSSRKSSAKRKVISYSEKCFMTGRKRVKRKRLPVVVPVKIKIPVATADMRRHSDTLRSERDDENEVYGEKTE